MRRTLAPLLAAALLVAAALSAACGADPAAGPEATGLRGQVLRGPLGPGPQAETAPAEEPFSALFHVLGAGDVEIARFRSDAEGRFLVLLPPGDYTVVPDRTAPLLRPELQRRSVTVPREGIAEVVLRFDTGLR